jgi:hypothetical protein
LSQPLALTAVFPANSICNLLCGLEGILDRFKGDELCIVEFAIYSFDPANIDIVDHVARLRVDGHGASWAFPGHALHGADQDVAICRSTALFEGRVDEMHAVIAADREQIWPEGRICVLRFAGLCEFVRAHHGWVTSVAGSREVRIDVLPDSALPATLERIAYKLTRGEDGTRILPTAITQSFVQNADGELAISEGSTRAVSVMTHSAGISPVERWAFDLP